MSNTLRYCIFLCVASLVAILSFSVTGPYSMRIDGSIYVAQVEQFEAGQLTLAPHDIALRASKPFIGIWGSLLAPVLTPQESIQLLNLLFLFAIPFVAFLFLVELGFNSLEATWGSLWIVTGYPVLKYGLAVSTDIGGWFFALVCAYLIVKGVRVKSGRIILLASLLGFIGATIKETGVFGLLFGGFYILFTAQSRPMKENILYVSLLTIPALVLEASLFGVLMHAGFPTFLDWFAVVSVDSFEEENYKLAKLIGVLASSFSILLVYASVGIFAMISKKLQIRSNMYAVTGAAFLTALPVLFWKIFISRILYIQFIFFVPMALQGVHFINGKINKKISSKVSAALYLFPIVCSIGLFLLAGNGSLFEIFL